ncbi:kelch-like protein 21 isoform X2 [Branchiostoma floridae x Branchiostoma belcheri]
MASGEDGMDDSVSLTKNSAGEVLLEDKKHWKILSEYLKEKDENLLVSLREEAQSEDKSGCHELEVLNEWRKTGKLCDFALLVGDREFPCHVAVLSASSNHFGYLCRYYKEDATPEEKRYGPMDDEFSADIIIQLLDFSYTGRVLMTYETANDLSMACFRFQFNRLLEIAPDSFHEIWKKWCM